MAAREGENDAGVAAPLAVLIVTCVSTLVVNANTSAVSILLPAISRDVGMSIDTLQWAVTGYSLVGAAAIVTSGALGDVFGRRRLFLFGLLLFVASCVFIALVPGGTGVIVGRCIQGAAGSTILACGLSLLSVSSSGNQQLRAVSYWGAASAVGAAAGPLVGGALVNLTGWEGLFWVDAAIATACIPVTLRAVQESRDANRSRSIDFAGSALIALILGAFILAVSKGSDWGWLSPATLGSFVVSVIASVVFIVVEQRVTSPLIHLRLLKNSTLVGSTLAILIGAGTINGLMFVTSLYFQDPAALGMSVLEAGLATSPVTVALVAVSPFVPRITTKIGIRATVAGGFFLMTLGFAALAFIDDSWVYGAFVVPLVVLSLGMGLSNSPASAAATASVDTAEVGEASGISNMARYVGAAVATAAVAALYSGVTTHQVAGGAGQNAALADGYAATAILLAVVSAAGLLLWPMFGRQKQEHAGRGAVAVATAAPAHTVPRPGTSASTGT